MIRCKPERNVRQMTLTLILCAAVFIGLAVAKLTVGSFAWIFETLLLVTVAVAALIIYRYCITEMEYEVGDGTFTVEKKVGRKVTTVCSLNLSTAISLIPAAEYRAKVQSKELPYINNKYSFCQNIKCASYFYVCDFNGSVLAVEFEPNGGFVTAMLEEISKSKPSE